MARDRVSYKVIVEGKRGKNWCYMFRSTEKKEWDASKIVTFCNVIGVQIVSIERC